MKTVTLDGGRVLKEEEDHNDFVALSERVGIEVYQVQPVWTKLGTRRMSDHGFGQSYLGRVSAFYDDVALAVELAHLDDDQCREAIQIAKVVGAKAGPGRLVGDARLSGSRVEIRGRMGRWYGHQSEMMSRERVMGRRVLSLFMIALSVLAAACAHDGGTAATPVELDDPVVRLEIESAKKPEGAPPESCSGAVINGGMVIAALDAARGTRSVVVVTSSGRRCPVTGVAGYSHEDLVLLVVDWRGVEPRHFDRVRELPVPGSILHLRPGPGLVDVKEASLKVEAVDPQETELEIPCEKPMARGYPGSPVVDYLGRLVGVVKGFNVSVTFHMGDVPIFPASALRVARPEIVDAMGAEAPIPWEEWKTVVVPRIDESRRLLEREEKAMRAEKYAEVIDLGHEAVGLDERNGVAWYWLAAALEETKEPEGALHASARAAALMPLSAAAWDGKAHAAV